jgi:hypothetical protein
MRLVNARTLLPALALFALCCAPHRPCGAPHGAPCHGPGTGAPATRACEPDGCVYQSKCYSGGAIRSNGGVCQECSSGKWVSATGCSVADGCKMGAMPCAHGKKHHPEM